MEKQANVPGSLTSMMSIGGGPKRPRSRKVKKGANQVEVAEAAAVVADDAVAEVGDQEAVTLPESGTPFGTARIEPEVLEQLTEEVDQHLEEALADAEVAAKNQQTAEERKAAYAAKKAREAGIPEPYRSKTEWYYTERDKLANRLATEAAGHAGGDLPDPETEKGKFVIEVNGVKFRVEVVPIW